MSNNGMTVTQFKTLSPLKDINLLVSGTVEKQSSGSYILKGEGKAIGISIAYRSSELAFALKQCDTIGFYVSNTESVEKTKYITGKVASRQLSTEYLYMSLEDCIIPEGFVPIISCSKDSGSGEILNYSSTNRSVLGLTPYIPVDFYVHDYNPNLNNVTGSIVSVVARSVEDLGTIVETKLDITSYRDRGVENLKRGSAHYASIPDSTYSDSGLVSGHSAGSKNEILFTREIIDNGTKLKVYAHNKQLRTKGVLYTLRDNLREGTESPFFYLQSFTGSFFVSGSQEDRIYEMDMNTGLTQIYYSKKPVYVSKSFYTRERTYVEPVGTVPYLGDTLYLIQSGSEHRLPEMKVYEPNTGRIHQTNDYGVIVSSSYVPRRASEDGYYSGSVSSYHLSIDILKSTTDKLYDCNRGFRYIVRISSDQVIPNMFFITFRMDIAGEPREWTVETALVGDKTFEILEFFRDQEIKGDIGRFGITKVVAGGETFTGPFVCDGHIWSADWYDTWDIWSSTSGISSRIKEADCWDEYGHEKKL